MRLRIFTLAMLISSFASPLFANPLTWTGYLKGEDVTNFRGGLRTGSIFNGAGQLKAIYDCEAAKLWQGGQFTIGVLGIGESHSPELYSAEVQSASNLSANSEIRLSNLSYEQKFNPRFTARVGIMDINDYFNVTEQAEGLLNDAFGISSIITSNTEAATYPYPGFGAMFDLSADAIGARLGLFQGDPQHQRTVFKHGSMLIAELYKTINIFSLKAGAWHYQQSNHDIGSTNNGFYFVGEAQWKTANNKPLGAFIQFGTAPHETNSVTHSVGVGFVAGNLSLGLTQVLVKDPELPKEQGYETVYEITYAFELTKQLTLNPDLQYIVHPSGRYRNALVGIIRLSYTF